MNKNVERLYNGIIKENPTFVLMLGMCPTLAVTSSAINGLGMGLSTTVVLVCSNLLISAFRKVIPNGVRMPAFIVIVASLVTMVQFIMQAYTPSLSESLGVYIPLIVVNCIILGRAESYASKNPVIPSIFDGLGMGLGFTFGLTSIGLIREIIGAGEAFGVSLQSVPVAAGVVLLILGIAVVALLALSAKKTELSPLKILLVVVGVLVALVGFVALLGTNYTPITIFVMAPGAFLVLACLVAIMNIVRVKMEAKGKPLAAPSGCLTGDCASCSQSALCSGKSAEKLASSETGKAE
ncbi:MAG: electron transport complex subunit RsxE [Roseburia sp.]